LLLVAVVGDVVVQLIHFLLESLQVYLYFVDFLFEVFIALVQSDLLLVHDHLLVFQVYDSLVDFLELVVFVDEHRLLFYPLPVELVALLLQFFTFPQEVDEFVLVWVFALVVGLAHEFVVEFVESADFVLLLLVDVVALLDLHFISYN
jgi:hypothetical protein